MLLAGSLTLSPLAASADGSSSPDVAALYASGALSDGASNTVHLGGETSATLSSGDSVSLPSSGTGEIHVNSPSESLGLGLPEGTTGAGSTLTPSSTLYGSPNNFSVAATITTSGVREAVTMENPSAPSTYDFPVSLSAGEFLTSNPDGSVSVMKSFSGGSVSVGTFQTPWAKDASGALVPTHYIVQGSTLIQQVEVTSATTFPVVADPMFVSVGLNGVTIRLTLLEQKAFIAGASAYFAAAWCATPGTQVSCPWVIALSTTATVVLNTDGTCPSSDYFWIMRGWMPWNGFVWGCRRY